MKVDVAIIGAGIAGASLAAEIAPHASVALIEAEHTPGYHSTGRSAAFWQETYGGPGVQPLTAASFSVLRDGGFLQPRGAAYVAAPGDEARLEAFIDSYAASGVVLQGLDRQSLVAFIPGLRPDFVHGLYEPSCADIDVAALHGWFLKTAARAGALLMPSARIDAIERGSRSWTLSSNDIAVTADVVVNAAGAWADEVAKRAGARPLGITPYRRTIAQLRVDPPAQASMPLVLDIAGNYYFKPDGAGRVWLSPHDETPDIARDVAPEEIDVAIAIDRLETVVDWRIEAVEHRWAGLRSFAPDRLPVYGFADDALGFFWCAGQGGFGIQTAPAAARMAAHLLLGGQRLSPPEGVDPTAFLPSRLA